MRHIDPTVFLADGCQIIGHVSIDAGSSVWYNAVIRAEISPVVIGKRTNIQDNVVIHTDSSLGVSIGDDVTVGHCAIVHCCQIGSNTLIGMGAIVLDGAVVGNNCIIGAGAVIPPGKVIEDNSVVIGSPGRVVRAATAQDEANNLESAYHYMELADMQKDLAK